MSNKSVIPSLRSGQRLRPVILSPAGAKNLRFFGLCPQNDVLLLSVFISGIALFVASGCASNKPLTTYPPLAPSSALEASSAFRRAVRAETASPKMEEARIAYLLERIYNSPYNFIRNESRYSGKRAWLHLKWKQIRNRKHIKTAEDFIQKVATSSKMNGRAYVIEFENKKRKPLGPILLNELDIFDRVVEKRKSLIAGTKGTR